MTTTTHKLRAQDQRLVRGLLLLALLLVGATASVLRANNLSCPPNSFCGTFIPPKVDSNHPFQSPPAWLTEDAFVRAVADLAIRERERSGIPASITAAQAILESDWGRAPIARAGNNYFGIKCKSYWKGKTVMHPDDDYDKNGRLINSCFRAYSTVDESFRDHSDFLRTSDRYTKLFSHEVTDYKAWAHGLRHCGYATDKAYGDKLIALIERLELFALDWPDAEQTQWLMSNTESGVHFMEQKQILATSDRNAP